jgi:hypothetical protein
VTMKILVTEFLWQLKLWWQKDISIITWFTMTKMTLVLVTCKLTLGNSKWPLT